MIAAFVLLDLFHHVSLAVRIYGPIQIQSVVTSSYQIASFRPYVLINKHQNNHIQSNRAHLPITSSLHLVTMTVVGAKPPKLSAMSAMTCESRSRHTHMPAFTIAMSSSRRFACLYPYKYSFYKKYIYIYIYIYIYTGPDPGRCNRCKCIGQKKIADAFIGQIFIGNNEKQHFLRKHKA